MIGGGPQKITVEIGGKIAASLGRSLKMTQMQVSSFGRNVARTMNDAATAGRKGFGRMFDNDLWQGAAAGAAAIGVGMAASVRSAAKFEQLLTEIGKTANVDGDGLKAIGQDLLALSARTRTNLGPAKLAEGVQDLVAQGLELKDAVASIEALGRVATATNSELTDVTKTGFQLQNALKIRPTELKATFDALAFAGKQGAFELRDMAQFMPTIASAAGDLGITGKKGAIELAAMMQMVRKNAPDSGQAATRLTDALMKMTAPDAVKNFKKFGVDIKQVMSDARKKGINPMEAAVAELARITGGDIFKLSQLFGDKEAKLALMSLMKYRKEYEQLKREAGGAAAAGTVDKDYERQIKSFGGTLASFQNSAQRLGITVGNALLPPLTRLAEIITPVVEGISGWATANPRLMTGIVAIGGALAGLTLALPVLAGIISSIGVISGALTAGAPILAGIGTVIALVAGPLTLAIVGVGLAIAAMIKFWPQISAAAKTAWAAVTSTWGRFTAWFGAIPGKILSIFRQANIGQKIIGGIIDGLKAKWAALVGWVTGAWSKITGIFSGGGGGATAAPPAATTTTPPASSGPYRGGQRSSRAIIPPAMVKQASSRNISIDARGMNINATGNAQAVREQVRLAFEDMIDRSYSDYRVALHD